VLLSSLAPDARLSTPQESLVRVQTVQGVVKAGFKDPGYSSCLKPPPLTLSAIKRAKCGVAALLLYRAASARVWRKMSACRSTWRYHPMKRCRYTRRRRTAMRGMQTVPTMKPTTIHHRIGRRRPYMLRWYPSRAPAGKLPCCAFTHHSISQRLYFDARTLARQCLIPLTHDSICRVADVSAGRHRCVIRLAPSYRYVPSSLSFLPLTLL
jgi:hypothetical protein